MTRSWLFMWFPTKPGKGWRRVSTRRGYGWKNSLWVKADG